jgi:hypothetical protein
MQFLLCCLVLRVLSIRQGINRRGIKKGQGWRPFTLTFRISGPPRNTSERASSCRLETGESFPCLDSPAPTKVKSFMLSPFVDSFSRRTLPKMSRVTWEMEQPLSKAFRRNA